MINFFEKMKEKPSNEMEEKSEQPTTFESCKEWIANELSEGGVETKRLLEKYSDIINVAGIALMAGGVYTFGKAGVSEIGFAEFVVQNPTLLWTSVAEAFVGAQITAQGFKKGHEHGEW